MSSSSRVEHYTENLCPVCHQQKIKLVRLKEDRRLTLTFIWLCNNPNCPQYLDYKKLKNWKRKKDIHGFWKMFRRQNRPSYNPNLARF